MKIKNLFQCSLIAVSALSLTLSGILYAKKSITISGSTTVLPIAQKVAEVFMDQNPGINITVRGGGSGVGVAALINGTIDIADSSRAMKGKEITTARQKGINPVANKVALDGIAIVVNKNNPIDKITLKQVMDIFTGKRANWNELGGPNLAIVPISRDVASGTFEVFKEKALKGAKLSGEAQMLASNKAIASAVTETPGAIGYIGIAYITSEMKVIPLDGIMPSAQTVRNGSYELARPLYMYTDGKPKGDVKKFIDFLLSNEGQKLVEEVGYIPLH